MEMVGGGRIQNAVSLNGVLANVSRTVGPAVAGGLIATVGVGVCFLVNGASFLTVLVALALMRTTELRPSPPLPRDRRQLRAGFRYVRETTGLVVPLTMMALIGTLAYEFPVVLPLLAQRTLHGGAEEFGLLLSAMGAGAVAGGLVMATIGLTGLAVMTVASLGFGLAVLAAALMPSLAAEIVALVVVGAASTAFVATGNSTLQLTSDPRFRGRVMALWTVTFQGSTAVGGPIVGAVSETAGARLGLALGAVASLVAVTIGLAASLRMPRAERLAHGEQDAPAPADRVVIETRA